MPTFNQGFAFRIARIWRVPEFLRAIAIHQDLARYQAHVAGLGSFENRIGRMRMHSAKHQGRRRAIAQQFIDERVCHFTCMIRVGEFRLYRVGILVQPVEQLRSVGTNDVELREMHMAVDEPGNNQFSGVVRDLDIGG